MAKEPQTQRRILLVLSGMSPQVVTGTLYGILHNSEFKNYHPSEIHLIATKGGIDKANELLLGKDGQFAQFCKDYKFPVSTLKPENVHVITDRNGLPLQDIRTADENEDMADFMISIVRKLTSDPNSQLHVSISGGRKTMSYFGGYALTMFGRDQDILSHVLVSDDYEFIDEYFYPTPYSKKIKTRNGKKLDARDAKIHLASIPYIHLRETLPASAKMDKLGFKETLLKARKSKQKATIGRDDANKTLLCSGEPVKLQRVLYGVYTWLLSIDGSVQRLELIDADHLYAGQVDKKQKAIATRYSESFMAHYSALFGKSGDLERTATALQGGMTMQWLEQKISRINSVITKALGNELAGIYKVRSVGGVASTYYLDVK